MHSTNDQSFKHLYIVKLHKKYFLTVWGHRIITRGFKHKDFRTNKYRGQREWTRKLAVKRKWKYWGNILPFYRLLWQSPASLSWWCIHLHPGHTCWKPILVCPPDYLQKTLQLYIASNHDLPLDVTLREQMNSLKSIVPSPFVSRTRFTMWTSKLLKLTESSENMFCKLWSVTVRKEVGVDLLELLLGQLTWGTVFEESSVPLLYLRVTELCLVSQILQHLRLQFTLLFTHLDWLWWSATVTNNMNTLVE